MNASPTDFAEECREAFLNHTVTLRSIDPNAWAQRNANAKKRANILARIDDVLDTYLDWLEVETFDRELAS
jgi:hypothetical protein